MSAIISDYLRAEIEARTNAELSRLRAENERLTESRDYWKAEYLNASRDAAKFANELDAAEARAEKAVEALRAIAEGNLGDGPGQANYARIKQVALASLPKENADAD